MLTSYPTMAKFSENLRNLRLKKGWTVTELAKKSGVARQSIESYEKESDQGKTPLNKNLTKLAHALHVTLEQLTGMEQLHDIEKDAEEKAPTPEALAIAKALMGLPEDDPTRKAIEILLLKKTVPKEADGSK